MEENRGRFWDENGRPGGRPGRLTTSAKSPYDKQVGSCHVQPWICALEMKSARDLRVLPPRSMVGQLTLDQHIGVRIPGGQPVDNTGVTQFSALSPKSQP